jgi:hypothetical protein
MCSMRLHPAQLTRLPLPPSPSACTLRPIPLWALPAAQRNKIWRSHRPWAPPATVRCTSNTAPAAALLHFSSVAGHLHAHNTTHTHTLLPGVVGCGRAGAMSCTALHSAFPQSAWPPAGTSTCTLLPCCLLRQHHRSLLLPRNPGSLCQFGPMSRCTLAELGCMVNSVPSCANRCTPPVRGTCGAAGDGHVASSFQRCGLLNGSQKASVCSTLHVPAGSLLLGAV